HASDRILKRMGRRTNHESIVRTIRLAREIVPDVTLRTSLISGFPGETEEDHKILLDFVKEIGFDHLGVFTYSREEGTPAFDFEDQVDDAVKIARRDEIMQLQEKISQKKLLEKKGRIFDIMIEGKLPEDEVYVGRSRMDAPDVDGLFYVSCDRELMTGDIIRARAEESGQYDLYGEIVESYGE
ncbi:MAG: 30S ribosomal protein S12 methylthiotransferase RimO, partial [Parasporobacterium sp.]|nr:30S ribosomal protein S12 methylthiotransferase RimO [Parasporobacterium sp.]